MSACQRLMLNLHLFLRKKELSALAADLLFCAANVLIIRSISVRAYSFEPWWAVIWIFGFFGLATAAKKHGILRTLLSSSFVLLFSCFLCPYCLQECCQQ